MPSPIRVLHAIHDYLPRHPAGSELHAAHLCRALAKRGLQPAVLCAEFDPARVHGQLSWRVHDGIPVVELVNNWQADTLTDTWAAPELERALQAVLDAVQPHVLHVHSLLNLTLNLPALARGRGIPVVATLHDYTLVCVSGGQRVHRAERHVCRSIDPARCARCFRESPFHARMQAGRMTQAAGPLAARAATRLRRSLPLAAVLAGRALARTPGPPIAAADITARLDAAHDAWRQCDLVVAPSASLARSFRDAGFPSDRLLVSDYGLEPLAPAARVPAPDGRLRIGYAGTLVWHKGVDLLIEAARRLPADRIEVLIFGDTGVFPDYVHELRRRASGLPIRFMGAYGRDGIASAFARIDVLAVPSRWMENSPLVIHEAFMAGVPVVAARIGGIPELIEHGVSGLLVEPDSPDNLAAALRRLVDTPGLAAALAAGAPRVKGIDDDAADWERRYRDALARAAPAAAYAGPTGSPA
jgi:glycosyltransferase involved in cell wall biosynthesis